MVWIVLMLWFAAIVYAGGQDAFVVPTGTPPVALLAAAVLPSVIFALLYLSFPAVGDWVHGLDMFEVVVPQTWRVIGIIFLLLWGLGLLPLAFAAAAGIGDIIVGVLTAFVTVNVARHSAGGKVQSYTVITLGMLDFVGAFGTATLSGGDSMQELPMVFIPAFGVPVFILLHLIAFLKLRRLD